MKILYLNDHKWLLSQNQRVRIDFLGYRWYKALAKHIKTFLKKYESERASVSRPYVRLVHEEIFLWEKPA